MAICLGKVSVPAELGIASANCPYPALSKKMPRAAPHNAEELTAQCNSGANDCNFFEEAAYSWNRTHALDFHDFRFFKLEKRIKLSNDFVRRLLHVGRQPMRFILR